MRILSYADLLKKERENEGEKLPIASILNKEIVVTGFDYRPSIMHKDKYLCLRFEKDGERHVVFTDSAILKKQCERFKDYMPFRAVVIQKGQYFTFS